MILKIDGVLFFGSASQIMSRIDEVMHEECVIIDCSSITSMDISAVFALEDLIMTLKDKKINYLIFSSFKEAYLTILSKYNRSDEIINILIENDLPDSFLER